MPPSFASAAAAGGSSNANSHRHDASDALRRSVPILTMRCAPSASGSTPPKLDLPKNASTQIRTSSISSSLAFVNRVITVNPDAIYSKDQLLALFAGQLESDTLHQNISTLFMNGWNPHSSNDSTLTSTGRSDKFIKHDHTIGAEVCWDSQGATHPLGLVDLSENEKELFSTTVNSPLKLPPLNMGKDDGMKDGKNLRRTSQSNSSNNSNTFVSSLSTPKSARPRRETHNLSSYVNSTSNSNRLTKDELNISVAPPPLICRRLDFKDSSPSTSSTSIAEKDRTRFSTQSSTNGQDSHSADIQKRSIAHSSSSTSDSSSAWSSSATSTFGSMGNFALQGTNPTLGTERRSVVNPVKSESSSKLRIHLAKLGTDQNKSFKTFSVNDSKGKPDKKQNTAWMEARKSGSILVATTAPPINTPTHENSRSKLQHGNDKPKVKLASSNESFTEVSHPPITEDLAAPSSTGDKLPVENFPMLDDENSWVPSNSSAVSVNMESGDPSVHDIPPPEMYHEEIDDPQVSALIDAANIGDDSSEPITACIVGNGYNGRINSTENDLNHGKRDIAKTPMHNEVEISKMTFEGNQPLEVGSPISALPGLGVSSQNPSNFDPLSIDRGQSSCTGSMHGFSNFCGLAALATASSNNNGWTNNSGRGTPSKERSGFGLTFRENKFGSIGDPRLSALPGLGSSEFNNNNPLSGSSISANRMVNTLILHPPGSQDSFRQSDAKDQYGDKVCGLLNQLQPNNFLSMECSSKHSVADEGNPELDAAYRHTGHVFYSGNVPSMTDEKSFSAGLPGHLGMNSEYSMNAHEAIPGSTTVLAPLASVTPLPPPPNPPQPLPPAPQQVPGSSNLHHGNLNSNYGNQTSQVTSRRVIMLMPDQIRWVYKDFNWNIQGPFSGLEMQKWFQSGFFTPDLLVKRVDTPKFETLIQLIRRVGNACEPFLVPQALVVPHLTPVNSQEDIWTNHSVLPNSSSSSPSSINTNAINSAGHIDSVPAYGSTVTSFSSIGVPLTEQQKAAERRKQEKLFFMSRHKEQQHILASQMLSGVNSNLYTHALHHGGNSGSGNSATCPTMPSTSTTTGGSVGGNCIPSHDNGTVNNGTSHNLASGRANFAPLSPPGILPGTNHKPSMNFHGNSFKTGTTSGHDSNENCEGKVLLSENGLLLERLTLSKGNGGANTSDSDTPSFTHDTFDSVLHAQQVAQLMSDRARLEREQAERDELDNLAGRDKHQAMLNLERLEQFNELRADELGHFRIDRIPLNIQDPESMVNHHHPHHSKNYQIINYTDDPSPQTSQPYVSSPSMHPPSLDNGDAGSASSSSVPLPSTAPLAPTVATSGTPESTLSPDVPANRETPWNKVPPGPFPSPPTLATPNPLRGFNTNDSTSTTQLLLLDTVAPSSQSSSSTSSLAPWAKDLNEPIKRPSLKEIQEHEAKVAANSQSDGFLSTVHSNGKLTSWHSEFPNHSATHFSSVAHNSSVVGTHASTAASTAVPTTLSSASPSISSLPSVQTPGLPPTSNWGSGSTTNVSQGTSSWTKSARKSTVQSMPKKSLQQIQKEEEARKRKVASTTAPALANSVTSNSSIGGGGLTGNGTSSTNAKTSVSTHSSTGTPGKRYADLAGKSAASTANGTSPWTVVGPGGKLKTLSFKSTSTTTTNASGSMSVTSNGKIQSPTAVSTSAQSKKLPKSGKFATGSAPASTNGNSPVNAMDEFRKWAISELRHDLNKGINVEEFVQGLLTFPSELDVIVESVHAVSLTMDSRHFAEEFIRRRKLAEKGIVDSTSISAPTTSCSGKGGTGGWSEVAKRGSVNTTKEEPRTFRVVTTKKKGKR